ncbi:MAG: aromatic ring-hydroxylating dioxygenase subunit alpha [Acidisphaera sp.]|nr:aromatic ring-hydroxylating dioxygenase subunit alpha [Acidisphaera sp.]
MSPDIDIPSLIARRKPGYSLEAPFYASQQLLDLDIDVIFGRHWFFAAVEPEIPEPGDYVTVTVGPHSVILLRDDDNAVRAFHNVCRHRGSRLVLDRKGFVGNLVCPYHQWTYDLSGALVHAESMSACFEKSRFGLKPVHVRSLAGLLFICLADQPPDDFEEMAAILEPYLAPHDLRGCKVATQIDIVEDGNWKLTIENNRECYHCGGHPELLCSLFHFFGYAANDVSPSQRAYYERFERVHEEFVRIWQAQDLPYEPVEKLSGRATGFRTERLALDGPGESYTMDAKAACRRLVNGFTSPRLGSLHLHTQPNAWYHFLGDHAVTFSTLPLAPDRTLLRTTWLVHRDAEAGRDYDLDTLTQVWRATNEQDGTFVGNAQRGIGSPAYEPGPYSPAEYMVDQFCTWYIERLSAHRPR